MKEFEAWVNTQIMINDMAHKESQKVYEEDQDERAKDAMIDTKVAWMLISFCLVSFENFKAGKGFHDCQKACLVREIIKRDRFLIFLLKILIEYLY